MNELLSDQSIDALKRIFIPGSNKYFGTVKQVVKNIIKEKKKVVLKSHKNHYSWDVTEQKDNSLIVHIFKQDKEFSFLMEAGNVGHKGLVYFCKNMEPIYFIENVLFFKTVFINSKEYFYKPRIDIRSYWLEHFREIQTNFNVELVYDEETKEIKTVSDFMYDDEKSNEILTNFIEKNKLNKNITKWTEDELFYFSLKCPDFVR